MSAEIIELEISQPTHEEIINRAWKALEANPDPLDRLNRFKKVADAAAVVADEAEFLIFFARDLAIELLCCLDTRQPSYQPRPHAEVVVMLHDLMCLLDGDDQ